MKKKLVFIGKLNDYEISFYQQLANKFNVEIIDPKKLLSNKTWYRKLPRFIQNKLQARMIINHISHNKDAHFIFSEREIILKTFISILESKKFKDTKYYLLLRNPVKTIPKDILQLINKVKIHSNHQSTYLTYPVYIGTFDMADSKQYGFNYYPQFISLLPEIALTRPIQHDFSFIGKNKGRELLLNQLESNLKLQGYKTDFYITDSSNQIMSYTEYVTKSIDAKCIVEIVQKGQTGMTLRPIEALLYNRKLLTNNPHILQEDFYHPDNILLFTDGQIDSEELKKFMATPIYPISEQIKYRHTTESVINQIINQI